MQQARAEPCSGRARGGVLAAVTATASAAKFNKLTRVPLRLLQSTSTRNTHHLPSAPPQGLLDLGGSRGSIQQTWIVLNSMRISVTCCCPARLTAAVTGQTDSQQERPDLKRRHHTPVWESALLSVHPALTNNIDSVLCAGLASLRLMVPACQASPNTTPSSNSSSTNNPTSAAPCSIDSFEHKASSPCCGWPVLGS